MSAPPPPFERVVARDLVKVFGPTRALAGVSLVLERGVVTTLEGPNGAGKSTLLALLATLARPTSGTLRFGDLDAREDLDLIRPAIGLVAHEAMVYPDLTVHESLTLMARLYELPRVPTTVTDAIERAGLQGLEARTARTLSRGQLQRLSLARALLHEPWLVLFDEPTTGLDAASTERLVGVIDRQREQRRIVVVVTHDRGFAERVADRRVFLERGRLIRTEERTKAADSGPKADPTVTP